MTFGIKKPEVEEEGSQYSLDAFQRSALRVMLVLSILTFVGANLHATFWRSSDWLVSTVLASMVVTLTNEERNDLSEAPLTRSATLDAAAQMKADDMAKDHYFAHFAPDGTSPWYWFDKAGYTYAYAGENLAIHFTDSSEVVKAWMKSPKHRDNIVNTHYTEIGVGTAKGMYEGYETVFVVQLFGTPAATPVVKTTQAPAAAIPAPTTTAPAPKATPAPAPKVVALAPEPVPLRQEAVLSKVDTNTPIEVTALEDDTVASSGAQTNTAEAPVVAETKTVSETENGVVVETEMISTSSGLAAASGVEDQNVMTNSFKTGLATQPNKILQIVYILFGFIVVGLLTASIVVEARRTHYVQMTYGIGLLLIMAGLWYINTLLTSGATIV